MRATTLLICCLVGLITVGCGREDSGRSPSASDSLTNPDGASGTDDGTSTGTFGDSTSDDGTGTGDDTTGGTGRQTGGTDTDTQTGTGDQTGTGTGGDTDVAGIYQGDHETTATTSEGVETYSGKIAVKVRDDGVFSGTGTGQGATSGTGIELSVSGQVTAGAVTATVTWKWPAAGGQPPAPVEMAGTGTVAGGVMTIDFTGGDQDLKFAGSITMDKKPE